MRSGLAGVGVVVELFDRRLELLEPGECEVASGREFVLAGEDVDGHLELFGGALEVDRLPLRARESVCCGCPSSSRRLQTGQLRR